VMRIHFLFRMMRQYSSRSISFFSMMLFMALFLPLLPTPG
jgi:hypothetical protein